MAATLEEGARIFGYYVSNPTVFRVAEFDASGKVVSLEEKPKVPKLDLLIEENWRLQPLIKLI